MRLKMLFKILEERARRIALALTLTVVFALLSGVIAAGQTVYTGSVSAWWVVAGIFVWMLVVLSVLLRLVGAGVESQSREPMIGLLRQGQSGIRHLEKNPRRVVSGGLRESARDPEPVVEDERVVARVVPGPSHLDDPQLSLHPELALSRKPEVQDSVHQIILLVLRVRSAAGIRTTRAVRRQLSQQERRAPEIPKPTDEGEHLPPRLTELRENLERIERVEDEEAVVERPADPLRVELEQVQPRLIRRSLQLLPQRA